MWHHSRGFVLASLLSCAFVATSAFSALQTSYTTTDPTTGISHQQTNRPSEEQITLQGENTRFACDESVAYWLNFRVEPGSEAKMIRDIIQSRLLTGDAQARAYWLYHAARIGYFTGNALAGVLSHQLHQTLMDRSGDSIGQQKADLLGIASSTLVESIASIDQNYRWVEAGVLNYPWDATLLADSNRFRWNLKHKQSNPLFALKESVGVIQASVAVLGRRARLQGKPAGVWLNDDATISQYPAYYLNDFHYQEDGWLSSASAERYEVSTETLFLGRQDSMQRQTVVPIRKRYGDSDRVPDSILEVGCGTGRLATFMRDNFPTSNVTLVDLSPFYLEKARKNDAYWREHRGAEALALAGEESFIDHRAPQPARFVQANAENLPFSDCSFDVVTTVYLFHELPHEARVNAAKELARVCKPGGMVVFSDSLQAHDSNAQQDLEVFSGLNEPHYASYTTENLASMFVAFGLRCGEKYMNSHTKTLTFYKPTESHACNHLSAYQ